MNPTFQIDQRKWRELALSLSVAFKEDGGWTIRKQSRLFAEQAVKLTQPKNITQGKNAVKRDVMRSMNEWHPDYFREESMKKMVRKTPREKADSALRSIHGFETWRVKPFSKRLHEEAKDRRGRVQKTQHVFAYERKQIRDYIKKIQGHVGRLKAGWLPSIVKLQGKTLPWVARHRAGARGFAIDNTNNPTAPSFTLENHALGVRETERKIMATMKARLNAMSRQLRLVLSGYSKDISAGIRAQSRSRRTS